MRRLAAGDSQPVKAGHGPRHFRKAYPDDCRALAADPCAWLGARINPAEQMAPQRASEIYAITLKKIADGSESEGVGSARKRTS